MALDRGGENVAADRTAPHELPIDELKSDVGAAAAVPIRTREGRSAAAAMKRVVRRRAFAGMGRCRVFVLRVLPAKIAQVDDVVDAPFFHADAAAPIGFAPAGRLDRVIRTERMQLAAGIARWLTARFAARVERATGESVHA